MALNALHIFPQDLIPLLKMQHDATIINPKRLRRTFWIKLSSVFRGYEMIFELPMHPKLVKYCKRVIFGDRGLCVWVHSGLSPLHIRQIIDFMSRDTNSPWRVNLPYRGDRGGEDPSLRKFFKFDEKVSVSGFRWC